MTNSNEERWPFDQGPNVAAVTSVHITEQGMPIRIVTHYADDHSWGFQSGLPVSTSDGQVVAMQTILKMDPTLTEIADLPPGWSASREAIGSDWQRTKII